MALSEDARITIGILSYKFVQLGLLTTVCGLIGLYESMSESQTFLGFKQSPELNTQVATYGLSIGVPLTVVSGIILYFTTFRGNPKS